MTLLPSSEERELTAAISVLVFRVADLEHRVVWLERMFCAIVFTVTVLLTWWILT